MSKQIKILSKGIEILLTAWLHLGFDHGNAEDFEVLCSFAAYLVLANDA